MHRTLLTAVMSFVVLSNLSCAPVETGRSSVGPAGGSIALRSGLTMNVPEGALEREVEMVVRDVEVEKGEHDIELEPHGLQLRVPGTLSVSDDGRRAEALEFEHGLLETRHREGRTEIRVERLGRIALRRFELRHGADDALGDDHGGRRDGGDDALDGGDDRGGQRDGGASLDAGSGASCVDDDTCACGSQCVAGACTAVVTCTTDANCAAGTSCRMGQRHGQACGVMACHP